MPAYYNENDPYAAAWLRNLIKAGLIAPGDVDDRSIEDVRADDLVGYDQCHFFAGIGGWSHALRLAGWSDDRPVWTGSCPCQPFSAAGKREGFDDTRHLWPHFFRLIAERRPVAVIGEQVAAAIGLDWLDHVSADLESVGYACGAVILPAASIGAPQGRHRIWFVADADHEGRERRERKGQPDQAWQERQTACGESLRSIGRPWPPGPGEVDRIPLLANGISGVMGGCKGYGNAIVPQVAAEVIKAYMSLHDDDAAVGIK